MNHIRIRITWERLKNTNSQAPLHTKYLVSGGPTGAGHLRAFSPPVLGLGIDSKSVLFLSFIPSRFVYFILRLKVLLSCPS